MADIDKLRGAPAGHTAKSSTASPKLKEAATIVASVVISATPMAAQGQENKQDPVDDGHKIEVVEQPRSILEEPPADTINFADAVKEMQEQQNKENAQNETDSGNKILKLEDIKDIRYYKEDKTYLIECNDGSSIAIEESALKHRKIEREAKRDHKEKYSEEVTVERKVLSAEEVLRQKETINGVYLGSYSIDDHKITMYDYDNNIPENVTEFEKEELARVGSALNDAEKDKMTEIHERSHASDFENRDFAIEADQSVGQLHRKDYDSEIKANIAEAAIALEKYKETGNIDDIKTGNSGELKEFKEWLKENPDKLDTQECKLKLAKAVHDGWLEENNKEESIYYAQAKANSEKTDRTLGGAFTTFAGNGLAAGAVVENQGNINDFLKMQKDLYKDTALGDVSSVCGGYVELGAGATMRDVNDVPRAETQAESLVQGMADGARTTRQATNQIKDALEVVKDADKDGVRTEKEQAKIDKVVQQACDNCNAQQLDKKTQDGITIARQTGRGWQNRISKQSDGVSKENINTNNNVASMIAAQKGGNSY